MPVNHHCEVCAVLSGIPYILALGLSLPKFAIRLASCLSDGLWSRLGCPISLSLLKSPVIENRPYSRFSAKKAGHAHDRFKVQDE